MTNHDKQRLEFSRSREIKFPPNQIHERTIIHPSAVIGKDGFGYIRLDNGTLEKFTHTGNVIIEKNVEIGAHTCIDRAAEGSTIIGEGTKIDNLVHIAHGAKIGEHVLIVAGSVIGGSAEIGHYTFVGINASIKNKVKVGKNCTIGMGAVVTKDVPDGETWIGNPAKKMEK